MSFIRTLINQILRQNLDEKRDDLHFLSQGVNPSRKKFSYSEEKKKKTKSSLVEILNLFLLEKRIIFLTNIFSRECIDVKNIKNSSKFQVCN